MSGGHFDYKQYVISDIVDSIESELNKQGKETLADPWDSEKRYYPTYSKEVQKNMKKAIKYLKIAEVYAHRVDYFLSGDDGEDSFLERIKEDLENIK